MVPEQLHQFGVTLKTEVWSAGGGARKQLWAHLSGAQEGQVTFSHQVKGRTDGSKDCDWSREVQERVQGRVLQRLTET